MPDDELFPGFNARLETAVQTAVTNALADIDVVNLKRLQKQLAEYTQELARAQAQAEVWQELAQRRKEDLAAMQERIAELETKGAFLESMVENLKVERDRE